MVTSFKDTSIKQNGDKLRIFILLIMFQPQRQVYNINSVAWCNLAFSVSFRQTGGAEVGSSHLGRRSVAASACQPGQRSDEN